MGEDIGSAKQDAEASQTVLLWPTEFRALQYDRIMG
jgi:hypothetical protein